MGVKFENDSNASRGEMSSYHRKPSFRNYNGGASISDVANVKPIDRDAMRMCSALEVRAKFTIGFEIEKNRLGRGSVRPYPLFCGFETDSSCGYEAVTNILPLIGPCVWRDKVYNMFHEAERVIDDQWSPTDYRCGGHMTVAVEGLSGAELLEKLRPISGIILALYRRRLNHHYCNENMTMLPRGHANVYNGSGRSSVANVKDSTVEFRIPSRIQNVNTLKRRYELMYVLIDSAMKGHSLAKVQRRYAPIVLAMYDGDVDKANKVMQLGKAFCKFIKSGKINAEVLPFVDRYGRNTDLYTRCARELENPSQW